MATKIEVKLSFIEQQINRTYALALLMFDHLMELSEAERFLVEA